MRQPLRRQRRRAQRGKGRDRSHGAQTDLFPTSGPIHQRQNLPDQDAQRPFARGTQRHLQVGRERDFPCAVDIDGNHPTALPYVRLCQRGHRPPAAVGQHDLRLAGACDLRHRQSPRLAKMHPMLRDRATFPNDLIPNLEPGQPDRTLQSPARPARPGPSWRPGSGRRTFSGQPPGRLRRQRQQRLVFLWKPHLKLGRAQQFILVGQIRLRRIQAEVAVQKAIKLAPVVRFVIVRARIAIFVKPQMVRNAQQYVKRANRPVHAQPSPPAAEAAIIPQIVDQQRRTGREQRRQRIVIRHRAEIRRALLQISDIRRARHALPDRRVPGHRHNHPHPLIQRAQHRRLPAAAGKPGHGHPVRIALRVRQQHVQPALHRQVEHGHAGHPAQIQMRNAVVLPVHHQLAHPDKLGIQGQHPPLGQVDAPRLFVIHSLPAGVVAVGIQYPRNPPLRIDRLVKQRRNPHSGKPLIPQLPNAVAPTRFDHALPFHAWRLIQQRQRVPLEIHVFQIAPSQRGCLLRPACPPFRAQKPRRLRQNKTMQIAPRRIFRVGLPQQPLPQRTRNLPTLRLPACTNCLCHFLSPSPGVTYPP